MPSSCPVGRCCWSEGAGAAWLRGVSRDILVRQLLARLDRDRQVVLRRRQRAGGELGVRARQVNRPVEVERHRAVRVGPCHLQRTVGRVGGDARGGVGEQDVQAARRMAVERREPELLAIALELDIAGCGVDLDRDTIGVTTPGPWRIGEMLRLSGQPVQARDREKAVLAASTASCWRRQSAQSCSKVVLSMPCTVMAALPLAGRLAMSCNGRWNSRDK